jgi:hypothetical protein
MTESRYPVRVRARLDTPGRWLWLVKWLLLIPHYIVLVFLWLAFIVLTLVAYVAVLFTGRYPRAIFEFNVGVLRWGWRVGYYGYQALGTDRYPPFTLADVPDYPATLHIDYPSRTKNWLPLVAWLLAIPQLIIISALNSSGSWQWYRDGAGGAWAWTFGPLGIFILVVALALLFTGRYPRGLYDLLIGIARWTLRVIAFVALLTGEYPPFRLDQGGDDPDDEPDGPDPVTGRARVNPMVAEPTATNQAL